MSNDALPAASKRLVERYGDNCLHLGLMLDKFAPWGVDRGSWDLVMKEPVRRRGQTTIQAVSGGQAKGLWLSTSRRAASGASPSLFEQVRADTNLAKLKAERYLNTVKDSKGIAFSMTLTERMAAGLGASHVLETGLTLERNTGLPYLPGSTVKGLARAWGLIEVAAQFNIALEDEVSKDESALNRLAEILMTSKDDAELVTGINQLLSAIKGEASGAADQYVEFFRTIFGSQGNAGGVCFLDGIYYGDDEPLYTADVMTPHYVQYYTNNGSRAPSEDDNPNPVSFLTVEAGNTFAFGLLPRHRAFTEKEYEARNAVILARDWLINALAQLGAGSKTAAGYGFFRKKSAKMLVGEG